MFSPGIKTTILYYPIDYIFQNYENMKYRNVKTRQQIAIEYGISPRTLRRWLKQNEIYLPKRLLCPKEQEKIYKKFGSPSLE